jgi:hypothetical protein
MVSYVVVRHAACDVMLGTKIAKRYISVSNFLNQTLFNLDHVSLLQSFPEIMDS